MLQAFVDGTNVALSGKPPTYRLETVPVEDDSLKSIQYVTPGLLGWAVAMSASFGAAATLNGWRNSKLLRRLQLSPAPTGTVVGARVAVTVGIALTQMAIFLGIGVAAFGLRLTNAWLASVPLLVVGTLCFMAIGLLAGAVAKTTEGAVNMANFIVLPMAFLSGSFFPLGGRADLAAGGGAPAAAVVAQRGHARRDGAGRAGLGRPRCPMAVLATFTLVVTPLAAKLFRWEVAT